MLALREQSVCIDSVLLLPPKIKGPAQGLPH